MWAKGKVNDRKAEVLQNKGSFIEERAVAVLALLAEGQNQPLAISGAPQVLLSWAE